MLWKILHQYEFNIFVRVSDPYSMLTRMDKVIMKTQVKTRSIIKPEHWRETETSVVYLV